MPTRALITTFRYTKIVCLLAAVCYRYISVARLQLSTVQIHLHSLLQYPIGGSPEPSLQFNGTGHAHKIPNILIFTHSHNLLNLSSLLNDQAATDAAASLHRDASLNATTEVLALHDNVRHTISLHPGSAVRFLTDHDCLHALRRVIPALTLRVPDEMAIEMHATNVSAEGMFKQFFIDEPLGMYKGDLCRGAALYETGGLYFDVDLGVRMNIFGNVTVATAAAANHSSAFLRGRNLSAETSTDGNDSKSSKFLVAPDTDFITVYELFSDTDEGSMNFFQAFIGAFPRHPILKRYLELFWEHYTHQLPEGQVKEGDFLGVVLLRDAYDEVIYGRSRHQLDTREETKPSAVPKAVQLKTELWQQIKLSYQLHSSPWFSHVPQLYVEGICSYAVVASVPQRLRQYNYLEMPRWIYPFPAPAYEDDEVRITVPFYSRVPNTRTCPVTDKYYQRQLNPWPPVDPAAEVA
jgi:Glycosyltransferase sugar-binding region containing DXD motif